MPIILEKINEGMKIAMKAKEQFRLEVLRMMKSKILNVNARGEVPEPEVVKILQKYVKSLKETQTISEQHGKTEAADAAKKEIIVVSEFLPPEMTEEQLKAKIQEVVAALGPVTIKDMGRIMKECMTKIPGVDGNAVKKVVGELLK